MTTTNGSSNNNGSSMHNGGGSNELVLVTGGAGYIGSVSSTTSSFAYIAYVRSTLCSAGACLHCSCRRKTGVLNSFAATSGIPLLGLEPWTARTPSSIWQRSSATQPAAPGWRVTCGVADQAVPAA